jgi:hypothetical protein
MSVGRRANGQHRFLHLHVQHAARRLPGIKPVAHVTVQVRVHARDRLLDHVQRLMVAKAPNTRASFPPQIAARGSGSSATPRLRRRPPSA